jgi:hypothetical protein
MLRIRIFKGVPYPSVIGRGVTDPAPDKDRFGFPQRCLGYGSGNPDLDPSVFNKFEGMD